MSENSTYLKTLLTDAEDRIHELEDRVRKQAKLISEYEDWSARQRLLRSGYEDQIDRLLVDNKILVSKLKYFRHARYLNLEKRILDDDIVIAGAKNLAHHEDNEWPESKDQYNPYSEKLKAQARAVLSTVVPNLITSVESRRNDEDLTV